MDLEKAAREYLEATEAVFDWMNNNDIVADHAEARPDDYKRVNEAIAELRLALAATRGG